MGGSWPQVTAAKGYRCARPHFRESWGPGNPYLTSQWCAKSVGASYTFLATVAFRTQLRKQNGTCDLAAPTPRPYSWQQPAPGHSSGLALILIPGLGLVVMLHARVPSILTKSEQLALGLLGGGEAMIRVVIVGMRLGLGRAVRGETLPLGDLSVKHSAECPVHARCSRSVLVCS